MKVIFLDVDGVLNSTVTRQEEGWCTINRRMLNRVKEIVVTTGCKIVISSTWRLIPGCKEDLENNLAVVGIFDQVIGETPNFDHPKVRHDEIRDWLNRNTQVQRFAIIDDTDEAGIGFEDEFFQTNDDDGLTAEIAKEIVKYLS
jgi:hypothetical protein